jgi:hypothetical protein
VKRQTTILVAFLLLMTIRLFAQDGLSQLRPSLPPDAIGSQLIAWSQLQHPQPLELSQPLNDQLSLRSEQPPNPQPTFTACPQEHLHVPNVNDGGVNQPTDKKSRYVESDLREPR